MQKKFFSAVLCIVLIMSLVVCGSASAEDRPVTLRLFAAWAEGNVNLIGMEDFFQLAYEKSNGTLIIEWGGGPEAIPPFQLAEAIYNGVVDVAWTPHTFNVSHIPVMEGIKLLDPKRFRENGGFEFIDQLYQRYMNARYLGATSAGLTYNLYTTVEIRTLDDFRGLTIRATPAYIAFVSALGAGNINMSPGETYAALERNVIQGTGWPSVGIADFGWQELLRYIIQPPFYTVDVALFVSERAWERLSENQRNALLAAAEELEIRNEKFYADAIGRDNERLIAGGMQMIELAPEIAAQYLEIAYTEAWLSVLAADPENGRRLQEFLD